MNKLITLENCFLKMGWKYVSYTENDRKYILYIEPMYDGNDRLYLPCNSFECENAIKAIRSVKWNRNLDFIEADYEIKSVSFGDVEVEKGSLESTNAGKEFLSLDMFDPYFTMEPEKVHELWCILEKRFAEEAEGKVILKVNQIVEGSVFDKITVPTLMNNEKVTVFIEGQ